MSEAVNIRGALYKELRRYTCDICGAKREIEVRMIEKWVAVCSHQDNRGGTLPVMQMREEGVLIEN